MKPPTALAILAIALAACSPKTVSIANTAPPAKLDIASLSKRLEIQAKFQEVWANPNQCAEALNGNLQAEAGAIAQRATGFTVTRALYLPAAEAESEEVRYVGTMLLAGSGTLDGYCQIFNDDEQTSVNFMFPGKGGQWGWASKDGNRFSFYAGSPPAENWDFEDQRQ